MINGWLASVGPVVGNHLWQSTAFAVVAWAVTLLLRKNQARVRYGVWLAASVKFLVPFSLLVGLGGMLPRPQHAVVTMPVYSAVDEVGMPFDEVGLPAGMVATTHVSEARHGAPAFFAALVVLWVCGVVVVLAVWLGGWLRVTRTLRRAARAEHGREAEILRRVQERMGGRGETVPLLLSRELMEPGMFGFWRPVLIWPERLSEQLEDEHVEAILAHELMHARRRDNLTAALHMVVEAAFWFHPLVWWMERRMVEERERACDEAVVEMGSRPGVYAESLLKACRFCVESPLVCVAGITGADLAARVRAIMTSGVKNLGLGGKLALAVFGLAAIAGPMAFGVVRMIPMVGQVLHATGPLPSYEVVAIKPSQDIAHGADTEGEQTHYLITAKMLIQFAYGIFAPPRAIDLNVVGGPDWINTDVFSIVGKMDSAEFEQEQKLGRPQRHQRRQLMEQSLLADRFKLKMHTEMQDQPVYALTVIKGGPKMTPAKDVTGGAHVNPNPGSMTPEELNRGLIVRAKGRGFEMTVKGMTLDAFMDTLMAQKETGGRSVVNQTGLTGAYDFTLVWGPEQTLADGADAVEPEEPPLFVAIQQQLGLKLVNSKAPAEVVVIDHIEKPAFDSAEKAPVVPASAVAVAPKPRDQASLIPASIVQEKTPARSDAAIPANAVYVPTMSFDVASIHETKPGAEMHFVGGRFTPHTADLKLENINLFWLIAMAYGVDYHQISGQPDWAGRTTFNVEAKSDAAADKTMATLDKDQERLEQQHMMQALLAERFNLIVHWATQEGNIYNLVLTKGGSKLQPAGSLPPPPEELKWLGDTKTPPPIHQQGDGRFGYEFYGHDCPIEDLVHMIGSMMNRDVVNKTGLTGKFDFHIQYHGTTPRDNRSEDPTVWPPLIDALEDQLGLKLETAKGPVRILVVDHVDKPSEN
jgi:bla regulator protein blaR1